MFTPMSITSLKQGKDLAHWHIRRLYGEPGGLDIDRNEANAEVAVSPAADPVAKGAERRRFLALSIWCRQAVQQIILRRLHRKDWEIPAA